MFIFSVKIYCHVIHKPFSMRVYCLLNRTEKIQENVTNDNSLRSKPTVIYVKERKEK